MRIAFHDTHVYPGCGATIADEVGQSFGQAEAEFTDGPLIGAGFARLGTDELLVRIAAYRTARGTAIPAKGWVLRRISGDAWKVAARAAAGP